MIDSVSSVVLMKMIGVVIMRRYKKVIFRCIITAVLCSAIAGSMILSGCSEKKSENIELNTSSLSADSGIGSVSPVASTVNVANDEEDINTDFDKSTSTTITFSGTSAEISGSGAASNNGNVTISAAGTYIISGSLTDGSILVEAGKDDVVRLVLDNAQISSSKAPAIYSSKSKKTIIILPDGTESSISDGSSYIDENDDSSPDAALFCKDDLTISGSGRLNVNGNAKNGITCKDILRITGGTINVTAVNHGITGRDDLAVSGGIITVIAQNGDGLRSTYSDTDKNDLGHVIIENADITVTAANDGIQAEKSLTVKSGSINITTAGGSEKAPANNSKDGFGGFGGRPNNPGQFQPAQNNQGSTSGPDVSSSETTSSSARTETNTAQTSSTEESRKGLKAGTDIIINGGTITADCYDDAIHSNNSVTITDGVITLSSGDDGIHADSDLAITGGTLTIKKSYEGLEAMRIGISGGDIDVTASDDGVNAAGGNDNSGFGNFDNRMDFGGKRFRPENFNSNQDGQTPPSMPENFNPNQDGQTPPSMPENFNPNQDGQTTPAAPATQSGNNNGDSGSSSEITISGGTLCISSGGDGLDSNSALNISGGTIILNGPKTGGNGIIDHDGSCSITGGLLIGAGTSDMLEMPDNTSTQNTVAITFSGSQAANTLVYITDSSNNVIAAMSPEVDFSCILLSSASLAENETYHVYLGGKAEGETVHGYYRKAAVSGGTEYSSFTVTKTVTYVNESGVYEGGQGGFGRGGFNRNGQENQSGRDSGGRNFRNDTQSQSAASDNAV